MKNIPVISVLLLSSSLLPCAVHADEYHGHHGHRGHHRHDYSHHWLPSHYEYAEVVDVDPVYAVSQIPRRSRSCREEDVTVYSRGDAASGMILGGIIGGVIGHQFDRDHDRNTGTIIGAVVGSSIGHDIASREDEPHTVTRRQCAHYATYEEEEYVSGYRVTYRYHDRIYVTRMREHPGDRIRINVTVLPEEES